MHETGLTHTLATVMEISNFAPPAPPGTAQCDKTAPILSTEHVDKHPGVARKACNHADPPGLRIPEAARGGAPRPYTARASP